MPDDPGEDVKAVDNPAVEAVFSFSNLLLTIELFLLVFPLTSHCSFPFIMHASILLPLLGLPAALAGTISQRTAATPDYTNLTVALVRAEPVNWPMPVMNKTWDGVTFDLNATVDKGVSLIEQAAEDGANLVVFPELWFPGYVVTVYCLPKSRERVLIFST